MSIEWDRWTARNLLVTGPTLWNISGSGDHLFVCSTMVVQQVISYSDSQYILGVEWVTRVFQRCNTVNVLCLVGDMSAGFLARGLRDWHVSPIYDSKLCFASLCLALPQLIPQSTLSSGLSHEGSVSVCRTCHCRLPKNCKQCSILSERVKNVSINV